MNDHSIPLDEVAELRSRLAEQVRVMYRSATSVAAGMGREAGIHPTDADALRVLDAASDRPTMGELGRDLDLSSAAVTALVDRLEHAGLARRVHDTVDRRRVRVELTELAHEVATAHLMPLMRRIGVAIDAVAIEDLPAVVAFLDHLVNDDST